MDSTALLKEFRTETRDRVGPNYLWSDAEIYGYMDDAQRMFCRLTGGIADASSDITQLTAPAGEAFVEVSPLILKFRRVARSDGREVEILNIEDLQGSSGPADYGHRAAVRLDNTQGDVQAVITGIDANKLRLLRVPAADETLSLIVYRLPLTSITGAGQAIEIDEQHHRHLLLWMRHLAHLKQDAETFDRGRSDTSRLAFIAYCDQAKAERERREHKHRTVAYGGY